MIPSPYFTILDPRRCGGVPRYKVVTMHNPAGEEIGVKYFDMYYGTEVVDPNLLSKLSDCRLKYHDVTVQRGIVEWEEEDVEVTPNRPFFENTLIRNLNTQFAHQFPVPWNNMSLQVEDLYVIIEQTSGAFVATRKAGINRPASKLSWESFEYSGMDGGPNEFIVHHKEGFPISMSVGQLTKFVAVPEIGDVSKTVIFPISNSTQNIASPLWQRGTFVYEVVTESGNKGIRVSRQLGTTTGQAWVGIVEFTGSNWIIQNNISQELSSGGVVVSQEIDSVELISKAFIVSSHTSNSNTSKALGYGCWFGGHNVLNYWREPAAEGTARIVSAVVQNNTLLNVWHNNSVDGTLPNFPSGQGGRIVNIPTCVPRRTFLLANSSQSGGIEGYPSFMLNYTLLEGGTQVEFTTARPHGEHNLFLQRVETLGRVV